MANSECENAVITASKLLRNQIFSGVYKERRLIEKGSLATYKDVIIVDKRERDFISVLRKVDELLKNKYRGLLTTCISENGSQVSLWTNMNGVAFGSHWFQVKSVTANRGVVDISVKYLRPMDTEQTSSTKPSEPIFDWSSLSINTSTLRNAGHHLLDVLTKENMVHSARFIMVVLLAAAMGCYQLLLLLMQLVHELNLLIRSTIPFWIVCVQSMTKAFGGVLILIAMMWRTPKKSSTTFENPSMMRYQQQPNRLAYSPYIRNGNLPPRRLQY